MDTQTASAQYRDALKKITHYERLYQAANYGGKNSARRCRDARQGQQYYEARRDEALAVLKATPDGVAWLDAQARAKAAKDTRWFARLRAEHDKRIVDEYLYIQECASQAISAWRLERQFNHTHDAAAAYETFQRARATYEGLAATIAERDLWKAVARRSAALHKAGRETPPNDAA